MALALFRKRKPDPDPPPVAASVDKPVGEEEEEQRYRPIEWWMVRKMLAGLRPYRRYYVVGIGFAVGHIGLELLGPQFVGAIINFCAAFTEPDGRHGGGWFERLLYWPVGGPPDANALTAARAVGLLGLLVGVWAATILASAALHRWNVLSMTLGGESVQFDYRRKLFAHLQRLSMSYYDKNKLGRIISRMTSDIGSMREVNVWGINHAVVHAMIIVVASLVMALTDWRMFLAVAPLAPVILVVNHLFIRTTGKHWQVVREGFTRVSTNLAENITGMRVVTAFNRQDPNLSTFNTLQETNTANNLTVARINGVFQPALELIRYVGRVNILVLGGYLVASGRVGDKGVGGIVTAYLYWDWLMGSVMFLGGFYNTGLMAMAGAERVFSLLDVKPEVEDAADAKPLPPVVGRVQFENVTFGYDAARPVLHDVSFLALPGQTVALVGHTGSGKSSIVNLIARFYQPQRGRVLIDGHDIRHVTGESLHHQMGLVLQNNYLFTGTVMDNIRYARPEATREQVIAAAKNLGTHDAIGTLKDGYDTDVGERGASMSLGQRQLICFTRAFLADPRVFMLDEATSAVDTHTEALIQASLDRLTRGRTTFVVAHRLSTIMKADQILVIDRGRIIERGTHDQLLKHAGKYAKLYEQFASGAADGEHA